MKDKFIKAGNIIQVNLVLGRQAKLIIELRKHIKHEVIRFHLFCLDWSLILVLVRLVLIFCFQLTMQTVASKSPLGWAVVHKIEGTKDFDPDVVDLDGEEVRCARATTAAPGTTLPGCAAKPRRWISLLSNF